MARIVNPEGANTCYQCFMSLPCRNCRDPYSFFLQVVSQASMHDDILAPAKFILPVQKWRMTTVQQVNGKFTRRFLHNCQARSIQLPRRNKQALSLLLFVFCSFLWIITILFLCGWWCHTVKITPYFALSGFQEQNSWRDRHIFVDADAVQNISGWQLENWACNDFIHNTACFKMAAKIMNLSR